MGFFTDKDREPKASFKFDAVTLRAVEKETYTESLNEPGCFHKRLFWEATVSNGPFDYKDFFQITGEGDTKAKSIVAAVEALLAK